MKYTINYFTLADLFIKKRDVARGGVEGNNSNFKLTKKDLEDSKLNKVEVIKMLKVFKTEEVWPRDEDGDKRRETVIRDYEVNSNSITIVGCTTDKANRFKRKEKNNLKKSVIKVHHHNKTIEYGNKKMKFNEGGGWKAFCFLHRNFLNTLSYEDMWFDAFKKTPSCAPTPEKMNKDIQNTINGIQRRMAVKGFPEDTIKSEENYGYRLTT